jgi:hypothetical protein
MQRDISMYTGRCTGVEPSPLTHALCPKSDEIWLWRRPGARQHGVQGTAKTLNDTVASDAGRHRAKGRGCECNGRKMTDGHNGSNYKRIFKQVSAVYVALGQGTLRNGKAYPKTGRVYLSKIQNSSL